MQSRLLILIRATVYGSTFVGFWFLYLPYLILRPIEDQFPWQLGTIGIAGSLISLLGAALMLWCFFSFVIIGVGTPAPFDAPRRLVIRGPYRFVRNAMYLGGVLFLCGGALSYRSINCLLYAGLFFLLTHLMVVFYEEPKLSRSFGSEYEDYCQRVARWIPRFGTGSRRIPAND